MNAYSPSFGNSVISWKPLRNPQKNLEVDRASPSRGGVTALPDSRKADRRPALRSEAHPENIRHTVTLSLKVNESAKISVTPSVTVTDANVTAKLPARQRGFATGSGLRFTIYEGRSVSEIRRLFSSRAGSKASFLFGAVEALLVQMGVGVFEGVEASGARRWSWRWRTSW